MEVSNGKKFITNNNAVKMVVRKGYKEYTAEQLLKQKMAWFFVGNNLVLIIHNEQQQEGKLLDYSCYFSALVFVNGQEVKWEKVYLKKQVDWACNLSGKVYVASDQDIGLSQEVAKAIENYLEKSLFKNKPAMCHWCKS